jgi:hypothetical protein
VNDLEGRQLLSFVGGWPFPESSSSAPAITTYRNNLYVAWRGFDDHVNIEDVNTGHKITLPETTWAAPALATYKGRLVLAWTGTDAQHHLNVLSTTDGVYWGDKGTLAQTTFASDGPALAAYRGSLMIAWTGTDTQLNDAFSNDAMNFSDAIPLGHSYGATSRYAPALAVFHGDLNIAWTGTDNRLNWKDLVTARGVTIGETSHNAPSLATAPNGDLYLAWTADNQQIHVYDTVNNNEFAVGDAYSPYGPSLSYDGAGRRWLAWAGTDHNGSVNYEVV